MSNILTQKLPQVVIIGNREVKINTDFSVSIQFEGLLNNKYLTDEEIWNQALKLYYPVIPEDIEDINEAITQMLWFYRCGKELKHSDDDQERQTVKIYSYEHDEDSIYSVFLEQYNIDLQEINYLHWWKFKALFSTLKEDTDIRKKMSIRAMDINKMPLEQREYYKKLKKIYEIPHDEVEEENDDLDNALINGESLEGLI